jgi:FAD:protein FMN transferase
MNLVVPSLKALFLGCLISVLCNSVVAEQKSTEIQQEGNWYFYKDTAMTTRIELEFWYYDEKEANSLAEDVFSGFHMVDKNMSRYRADSELSMVNARAINGPTVLSEELFNVLKKAQEISELSNGAFDISFGSVGYLYDYRNGKQPTQDSIDQLVGAVDYRKIFLDPVSRTVELKNKNMRLDLGGIAKGYAVDQGINTLKQFGVSNARLSAGGDMRLLGDKRGKPWIVGVQDPRAKDAQAVVLPLFDVAVSTSGDYERFFVSEEGERVHHILSPKTGKPSEGVQSVTIIGQSAMETDALSTAVFVLGVKKGLHLINSLPDLDAIILDEKRTLHYSNNLMAPE